VQPAVPLAISRYTLVAVLPHNRQALTFGLSGDGRALGFEAEAGKCLFRSRYAQICDDRPGWGLSAGTASYRGIGPIYLR
jgi:hypothetical protein